MNATLWLTPHPSSAGSRVRAISVDVASPATGSLLLVYRIEGDIENLRIPAIAAAATAPTDELWKHTCLEAFIGARGRPGYFELNFSPSTQWAAYRFEDYRQDMRPVPCTQPPAIACHSGEALLEARIGLRLEALEEFQGEALRLGLAVVIEDMEGRLSYWALAHAPGNPDFHHPATFAYCP